MARKLQAMLRKINMGKLETFRIIKYLEAIMHLDGFLHKGDWNMFRE
jgi:hypothetical protein